MSAPILPLLMLLAAPAAAPADLRQLCDVASRPREGLEVQARGRLFFGAHGASLSDFARGCAVAIGWERETPVGKELYRLSFSSGPFAPADVTVTAS